MLTFFLDTYLLFSCWYLLGERSWHSHLGLAFSHNLLALGPAQTGRLSNPTAFFKRRKTAPWQHWQTGVEAAGLCRYSPVHRGRGCQGCPPWAALEIGHFLAPTYYRSREHSVAPRCSSLQNSWWCDVCQVSVTITIISKALVSATAERARQWDGARCFL